MKGGAMGHIGSPRQMQFEAAIYNREVRLALKDNRSHSVLGDHWANTQYFSVIAETGSEARAYFADRYPPDQGFVIADLTPVRIAA